MKFLNLLLVLSLVIGLSSCETTEKAEKCVSTFFTYLNNEDYKGASSLIADNPLFQQDKVELVKTIKQHPELGKLLNTEKRTGFNTSISNGIATVIVPYALTYENGSITYSITLVDRGNGFKIHNME